MPNSGLPLAQLPTFWRFWVYNKPGTKQPFEVVLEFLRNRKLLLLLDNCEHLEAGCATLVAHLLQICPRLVVLATSRAAPDIPGEVIYQVSSQTVPEETSLDDDSLQLEAAIRYVDSLFPTLITG